MELYGYKTVAKRRFYELKQGEIFKATIHDIRPNEVTIRLGGGELYTARSYVLPEARIGEESLFCVQENDLEGRIVLKMVKIDSELRKTKMLTEALINAGVAPTDKMLELARAIINNGLPVDTPTLQKAAALTADEDSAEDIISFLLKNIPAVQKNVPPPERFSFDMRV
ncbi:MAG: hypothetical protein LBI27_02650 [Clostridiales bacterium]|jgi:hypothetical protein|nr:hypothetical protein [Clostridiales bacterium]